MFLCCVVCLVRLWAIIGVQCSFVIGSWRLIVDGARYDVPLNHLLSMCIVKWKLTCLFLKVKDPVQTAEIGCFGSIFVLILSRKHTVETLVVFSLYIHPYKIARNIKQLLKHWKCNWPFELPPLPPPKPNVRQSNIWKSLKGLSFSLAAKVKKG